MVCCSCFNCLVAVLVVVIGYIYYRKFKSPSPIPKFYHIWWGPGDESTEDKSIKPFEINVSDEVLKDLKTRLDNTLPFQEPLEGAKQHYGMNTKLLSEVVDFWKTKYNWREREKFLNQYPQFQVSIQGLKIHFLHIKPKEANEIKVLPLLLVHGWPGSIREFYEIIPILTTPQKARNFVFEVIVPSLPGYGFSDAAVRPGVSALQIAIIFHNLMLRLGIDKFYIQGGDWGSSIVTFMADLFPDRVIGMHSNMLHIENYFYSGVLHMASYLPFLLNKLVDNLEAERSLPLSKVWMSRILESGYMHLQASKPDTIGVALRESPVGLAAYILEKFTTWTNPSWKDLEDGGLTKRYNYTNLLDNVMIYWVTRSITTSMRLYAEQFAKHQRDPKISRSRPSWVPTGGARFQHDLFFTPRIILETKFKKLVQLSDFDDAGHFPAFEVPHILAEDIYNFVEKVQHFAFDLEL